MRARVLSAALVLASVAALGARQAASPQPSYLTPPKVISDILDAQAFPFASVSPTRERVAMVTRRSMPTIAEIAQPMLRLAGYRIDPRTNGPYRRPDGVGIVLKSLADARETQIATPGGAAIGDVEFAPDGTRVAFTATRQDGVELWVADASTGAAKALTTATLNAVDGAPCHWLPSGSALLCRFVRADRGTAPAASSVPTGPNIQESGGNASPVATFQDLLETPHDEALFEFYFSSQLATVDAATGQRTPVGAPAIFDTVSTSPDGRFILVATSQRPFSRLVRRTGFPRTS